MGDDVIVPGRNDATLVDRSYCCLHIGLNKTGTSLLQKRLFPHHPEIAFLGKFHERQHYPVEGIERMIERMVDRQPLDEKARQSCRDLFAQHVAPLLATGRVPLWSREGTCSGPVGIRRQRAENFRDVFGSCRVVIVLRHPLSLAESLYFQRLKGIQRHNGSPHFKIGAYFDITEWLERCWLNGGKQDVSNIFDYARTVNIFSGIFGKQAVGVFLFEQLVAAPEQFVADLCRFIGVDSQTGVQLTAGRRDNVRWSEPQIEQLRRISRSFLKRALFRLCSKRRRMEMLGGGARRGGMVGPKAHASMTPEWEQRISDYTREGNRMLVQQWNLPLEQYGYPL